MEATNLVVLRGTISGEPHVRELPSGDSVTQLVVTTRVDGVATTVPVAVHDRVVAARAGDEVVVVGHVRRRFFRAGGVTQSRTEVIAERLVRAGRRATVARLLDRASHALRV